MLWIWRVTLNINNINIKNHTCYCFDDIIRIADFYFDIILLDKKSYENVLVYNISYKSLIFAKLLRIRLDKIDGFIKVYDGTVYLVLFDPEKYYAINNRIRDYTLYFAFFSRIMQESKVNHIMICL